MRETGRGESEEEEDWDMIRECVSKGVCMQEGGGKAKERDWSLCWLTHCVGGAWSREVNRMP